jgi:uncharacterized protein YndB with AHSA1/START domain
LSASLQLATPTDTTIVLTREFDAPRRLVFDAFTKPDLLKRWFGRHGWNLVTCEVDLRVGGRWRFVSRRPGGAEMGHGGVYREVVAPERLVYTESYDDQWFPGESLVITVLTEQGDTTTMTSTLQFRSREVRDAVIESPMREGVSESYGRLDEVLTEALR